MKQNIIIDCDPGIDDAVALCLAFANDERLNILGITTVAGNQTINNVTDNALKLCEFFGHSVPVIMGSHCPLVREKRIAAKIHGKTGLGNSELPDAKNKIAGDKYK